MSVISIREQPKKEAADRLAHILSVLERKPIAAGKAAGAMRLRLQDEARKRMKQMVEELKDTHFSYQEYMRWDFHADLPEWKWPIAEAQERLEKKLKESTPKGAEHTAVGMHFRWARYHAFVIGRLGELDGLLQQGRVEEFVQKCGRRKGLFRVKFSAKGGDGRQKLGPHFPVHTAEFHAILKEMKKEGALQPG